MVEWFVAWLNQCILMYEICYINSKDKIIEHVDIRSGASTEPCLFNWNIHAD